MMTRPQSRNQRGRELTAGDDAYNESSEPQTLMDVEREHWHRKPDDEVGQEHDCYDRQECNHRRPFRRRRRGNRGHQSRSILIDQLDPYVYRIGNIEYLHPRIDFRYLD